MAAETTFTLTFKTIAELTGLDRLAAGLQSRVAQVRAFNQQMASSAATVNNAIAGLGTAFFAQKMREFAREALEARTVQAQLDQALRNTGQATAEYREELAATADELSRKVGIDDDDISAVQKQLVQAGVRREDMRDLTRLTLDFASAQNMATESAAQLVARGLMGEDVMLGKFRISIDKTLPKAQQIDQVKSAMARFWEGQAEASNKASGGLKGLGVQFDQLGEDIGELELKIAVPFFQPFVDKIRDISRALRDLDPATIANLRGIAETLGKIAAAIVPVLGGLLVLRGAVLAVGFLVAPLRSFFVLLTGLSFLQFIVEVNAASRVFGLWNALLVAGTGNVGRFALALRGLGLAGVLVGTAFAGWELGKWLGTLRVADATVNQWTQRLLYGWIALWQNTEAAIGRFITTVLALLGQLRVDMAFQFEMAWIEIKVVWEKIVSGLRAFLVDIEHDFQTILPRITRQVNQWALNIASAFNRLPLGIDIDTSGLQDGIAQAEQQLADVEGNRKRAQMARLNDLNVALKQLEADAKKIAADSAAGGKEVDAARKERLDNVTANLKADMDWLKQQAELLEAEIKADAEAAASARPSAATTEDRGSAKPGLPDNTAAKAAATEALTAAKFRLASAEQSYKTALEQTKLLEEQGLITRDEANRRSLQATRDYIAELERMRAALPAIIAQMEAAGNTKGAQEAKLQYQELTNQILEAQRVLADSSFFGKMRAQIRQLAAEWADVGKQVGGFLTQQFQNFAATAAQVITGLIFRTGNWKQAILQLGQSFVQAMIQMLIQWVLSRTIMSALNKAFGAADAAATKAQAGTAAAAWAPAATAASIASYGAAAGAGLAAYLSAIATGTAATVASSAGGFMGGGFTGHGPETGVAGPVHFEEVVFPKRAVEYWGRETLVNMALGTLPQPAGYQRGGVGGGRPGAGVSPAGGSGEITVINVNDWETAVQIAMKRRGGRTIIVDTISDRKFEV